MSDDVVYEDEPPEGLLRELWQRSLIERLIQAYAVAIDHRDLAGLTDLFAEDARARYGGQPWLEGAGRIVDYLGARTEGMSWQQHVLVVNRIELLGERARVWVYDLSHQTRRADPDRTRMLSGEYRIELRRDPAHRRGWRIEELDLRTGWVEQRRSPQDDPLLPPHQPPEAPPA